MTRVITRTLTLLLSRTYLTYRLIVTAFTSSAYLVSARIRGLTTSAIRSILNRSIALKDCYAIRLVRDLRRLACSYINALSADRIADTQNIGTTLILRDTKKLYRQQKRRISLSNCTSTT